MHLRTVFQCVPCDQRSSLVRDFFLFVCIMSMRVGHSILATSRVCHTHDCRFLDFRVRRFDNKLQVAFDRVRCWFVEVPFFLFFSFFSFSTFPGLVELGKHYGVREFYIQNIKKTATQITPTATQFNFRVAETAMQKIDSKFIPANVSR